MKALLWKLHLFFLAVVVCSIFELSELRVYAKKIHITIFAQYYNLQNEVKEFKKVYTIAKYPQFHKMLEYTYYNILTTYSTVCKVFGIMLRS